MDLDLEELKIKIEFMQNNISEMNLFLEEAKQKNNHSIPQSILDIHKETTDYARDVSEQLKQLAHGSDMTEMKTQRILLNEFLATLSDLNLFQKHLIENFADKFDGVDCGSILQNQSSIGLLSQLTDPKSPHLWITISAVIIGSLTLFKSLK